MTQNDDALKLLAASEQRLAAQSNALTELTARHTDSNGPFDERLREILLKSAQTLRVERVSMWRLVDDGRAIVCLDLYAASSDRYEHGARLDQPAAPDYFAALGRDRVIAAHDAQADPRTCELRESYLAPLGIGAMLDVPLRHDGAPIGVLCCEHVGSSRVWTVDEQNFALSAANLIAIALANHERRRAVARLADSEARARLLIDTAHDAFVGMDSAGRIVGWNTMAELTFGWAADDVLGRVLGDVIVPAEFREAHRQGLRRFLDTGDAPVVNKRLELKALHRSGHEFPVELTITSPIRDGDGFFFGAFLRDISERKERDEQLRRAKDAAEAATRAKSEFLANMSHELRTPLNGVLGYAQLLQRDRSITAKQREALDAIAKSGSHLLDVINEILDLSKIEAGYVETETSVTNLTQLVADLRQLTAESARRKHLKLATTVAVDVPRTVMLDRRHLRQVLLNLLGNAIKFTVDGEVQLRISRAGDEQLMFEVSDTGIGIEPDALTAIFDSFTQTAAGAAAGGTGLGLTISRRLVATMGGDLRVESMPGSGSRFFFALPLVEGGDGVTSASGSSEPPLNAELAPGQTLTALVADDSSVNRRILAELLESTGARVIRATGGEEAVRLARECRPDVVFMDLKMPDLNGLDATRRLRADSVTAHIPVIAVTASALGDTPREALEAGCVDYIPKPVRARALFASLRAHVGVQFVARAEPAEAPTHAVAPERRLTIATRLRQATAVGDVSAVDSLVAELAADDAEAALAKQIEHLASNFDFDGLRVLADSLDQEAERDGA